MPMKFNKIIIRLFTRLFVLLLLINESAYAAITYVESLSLAAEESYATGIEFNSDGTKMFIVGLDDDEVNEYTLTTGFDISTASYSQNFSVSGQDIAPRGLAFNSDGTKMFVTGNLGYDINEYTLTTGFDISTASYTRKTSNLVSYNTVPTGLAFNSDGTKVFLLGANGAEVNVFTLSTGFNVSTASFSTRLDISGQETHPNGIAFNSDGTKMFIIGHIGDDINAYTLSTGFDISTASFVDSVSTGKETFPLGFAFNSDGTKMFIIDADSDKVNSYTLNVGFEVIDSSDPTLSSSSPSDGATGVAVDANIVLTFSEAVDVESGNITLKKPSDDSTVETIDVTGSLVTGTGTTEITINPSADLGSSTGYYLNIAATAFDDSSSNSYAGITDSTTLNFTTINLPSPLDKKDVIGSIEAWNDISSRWAESSSENALSRIDWLNRQRGSNQTSHQGIKFTFVNSLIDSIMNNSSGAALSDIDVVDTTASLIGSSNATLDEVSDNAESKASNIAINEAARLRESLIGSLNPSFGPVIDNWSMWAGGKVVIGNTDASTTASKKEIEVQAISLGIDRPVGDGDELMGFVLSIGQDDTDIGTASTNVKSDNYSISNYNVFRPSANTQIETVFGLGLIDFDTTRSDGSDTLSGTRKANQLFLTGVIRPLNRIHLGSWQFSPYSKVSAANTSLKAFSESGGATALTHNKQKIKDTAVAIGLDIHSQITRNTRSIKPFAKAEYKESSSKTTATMHYNSEDASTYTYTKRFDKRNKHWKLKLGLDLNTESGWNSSASYTREQSFGSSDDSQTSDSFSLNAVLRF